MKKYILITVGLFCIIFAAPLAASKAPSIPEGPKVKVLLEKDTRSAILEVKGNYRVIRKDTGSVLSSGSKGKRFVIHALQKGLRWGEEYPDVYQISVVPQNPSTHLYVNGIQYKGAISVYHVHDNQITLVNEVAIEDYLKSTLALQFERPLIKEAMAALTIIARTEAYSLIMCGRVTPRPWDITAEESGYWGYGVTKQFNHVDKSVDETRFMVMESAKDGRVAQNVSLAASKAEELAYQNYDAKKILRTSFPNIKLGVTINPEEIVLR